MGLSPAPPTPQLRIPWPGGPFANGATEANVGKTLCGCLKPVNLKSQGHLTHWVEHARVWACKCRLDSIGTQWELGQGSATLSPGTHDQCRSPPCLSLALTGPLNNRTTGRRKACLGGKYLGHLTQNNSFIQKLLVCDFPPSLNQARKPSLMGPEQPPWWKPSCWAVRMGSNGDT